MLDGVVTAFQYVSALFHCLSSVSITLVCFVLLNVVSGLFLFVSVCVWFADVKRQHLPTHAKRLAGEAKSQL